MSTTPPNFWQVLWSALCALVGVQSERNRQRDFTSNRSWIYVTAGLLVSLLFILLILLLVKLNLPA